MKLILERGKVWKLDELPSQSIAIDGAVSGPQIDPVNKRFSFDHHAGCYRFCTQAACQQTWNSIMLGLDPSDYNIFINDADTDVCLSVWLLNNPNRCNEPLVQKLVSAVNIGDMHAGAVNLNGMHKTVEWISQPETDSKRRNDYGKISSEGLNSILEAVLHRITLYADGEASAEIAKIHKHNEYKILRNENNYVVVESHDPHVFGCLYNSGFEKLVLVRKQTDDSLAITIAKKSDFVINFPLEKIYEELNKIEPMWGGSSTIGGAPRHADGSRSKLPLEKILEVIDNIVKQQENT